MRDPEEADAAVALLNGRWFCQRLLSAEIWNGKTKYKYTTNIYFSLLDNYHLLFRRIAETDAQLSKRLTDWDKFLDDDASKVGKENASKEDSTKQETKESKAESSSTPP